MEIYFLTARETVFQYKSSNIAQQPIMELTDVSYLRWVSSGSCAGAENRIDAQFRRLIIRRIDHS